MKVVPINGIEKSFNREKKKNRENYFKSKKKLLKPEFETIVDLSRKEEENGQGKD